MLNRRTVLAFFLVMGVMLVVPACKKAPEVTPEPPAEDTTAAPPEPAPAPVKEVREDFPSQKPDVEEIVEPSIEEINRQLRTVYFDFDKYDLSDQTRQHLRGNADLLKANDQFAVVIAGHCDERGSIEYNLALGERRANAVRDYLGSLGVAGGRMRIVSYGEERPADPGHSEAAWAKNRRAEFTVER